MKIALIGYGKMGKMIEKNALERGHEIVACINSKEWNADAVQQAEMCIEFSHPEAAVSHIKKLAALKKDIVIGTTGWYNHLDHVQSIVDEAGIGALYSPNFSIGIYLMMKIVEHAASLMNAFKEYDVACVEAHHRHKVDSPSGTAEMITKAIEGSLKRIDKVPTSSIRCGSIPGTHSVIFDSPCDHLDITHTARNREGFASGAVVAGEWLQGKKGLYTFNQCMQSIIEKRIL